MFLSLFNLYINITSQSSLQLIIIILVIVVVVTITITITSLLLLLFIIYIVNLHVIRPRSCRVIYYFDTPTLGRRHQSFGRVTRSSSFALHGFIDGNWADNVDDRKTIGGYLMFFGQTSTL